MDFRIQFYLLCKLLHHSRRHYAKNQQKLSYHLYISNLPSSRSHFISILKNMANEKTLVHVNRIRKDFYACNVLDKKIAHIFPRCFPCGQILVSIVGQYFLISPHLGLCGAVWGAVRRHVESAQS